LQAGLRDSHLDRDVDLIVVHVDGLPEGTAHAVTQGFTELVSAGAVAIVGPAVTDNALIARDLADAARVPCLNWSGNERTRGRYCFQYQVGSLEEEAAVVHRALQQAQVRRVAVVHDRSEIGDRYHFWFRERARQFGVTVVADLELSPVGRDAGVVTSAVGESDAQALVYLGLGHSAVAVADSLRVGRWDRPCFANTALMYGHMFPERRQSWDGWTYVDMFADDNPALGALRARDRQPWQFGPIGVCSYDMGRIVGEALNRAPILSPEGLLAGLEQVKQLDAVAGHGGTTMTLGQWDHAALKGPYLVLRSWRDGKSVPA
jgi:ABC-type branched-subunit amino acid transport system substrate-binding protein